MIFYRLAGAFVVLEVVAIVEKDIGRMYWMAILTGVCMGLYYMWKAI